MWNKAAENHREIENLDKTKNVQDQLQGIILKEELSVFDLSRRFNHFCDFDNYKYKEYNPYTCRLNSMEQLWLAFVMKEKYNKIWNGEKWNRGGK